ncbi:hypothetical protein Clacol_009844 [Clathrus columnatus]|uniref:peptidylprolyl isomerase n=1 Tax=Clathrus columnatus TaxID=1419009 RepID=A0AAV5ARY8_9AGAM|nr:hypothetical protein Clacol_009844 [Clathrus columnatus]
MAGNGNLVLGKHARGETELYNSQNVGIEEPIGHGSEDEGDIGPMPLPGNGNTGAKKKRKGIDTFVHVMFTHSQSNLIVLPHEKLFLEHLPNADRYYKSFMHRDFINFVTVTKSNFIITTSVDGHLKLWKKQDAGIEFVKHYRAHLAPIISVASSADGTLFASIAEDGSIKVSDANNGLIRIYDARGDNTGKELYSIDKIHKSPYSDHYDVVVSADEAGFVEYWRPMEPWNVPSNIPGLWKLKSTTDLYEFRKTKNVPTSLTFSPDSAHYVIFSMSDRQIRVFNFLSAKMTRKYDESLTAIQEIQQLGASLNKLDDMEFGRRLAVERDLEKEEGKKAASTINAIWDESVVNILTNRVVKLLGKDETCRWLNLSIYQGAPAKQGLKTVAMTASANPILAEKEARDPTLFCTAYKRQRFYMFTRSEPEDNKGGDRDVFNEKPTREEQTVAHSEPIQGTGLSRVAGSAVLHTTEGDIHLRLFPDKVPKAVENFVGHARSGYYEGVIFHRVMPKFMIQTGDPLGDGTGGTSIWGRDFEDEFTEDLKHDRPYTVSMANAGPNTNGSQFFITTTATPWLDRKHTIFGRLVQGLEVVHKIENARTNKADKPYEDIKIINIDVL